MARASPGEAAASILGRSSARAASQEAPLRSGSQWRSLMVCQTWSKEASQTFWGWGLGVDRKSARLNSSH